MKEETTEERAQRFNETARRIIEDAVEFPFSSESAIAQELEKAYQAGRDDVKKCFGE